MSSRINPHDIVRQTITGDSDINGVSLEHFQPRAEPAWDRIELMILRLCTAGLVGVIGAELLRRM